MNDKNNFQIFINYAIVIVLFILAGIILYPIIYAIIYGILFAYVFFPIHRWILKKVKSEFLSAFFVCAGVFVIVIGLLVLAFETFFKEIIDFYLIFQKFDFVELIKKVLPNIISSSQISDSFVSSLSNSLSNLIANYLRDFTNLISNIPFVILQLAVFIFTFFYALKDGHLAIDFLKSMSHFKKETEDRFFKQFKDVTNSVLIGQIIVGIIQGIIAGIGYYVFGVPNALLLTVLTILFSIIPLVGAWLVWLPVDIYLFATGNTGAGIGLLIYGSLVISLIDNVLRSLIVSRRAKINNGIVIIGMLGGLFVFGFLGLIVGPLILAYVILALELYRKNTVNQENSSSKKEVS